MNNRPPKPVRKGFYMQQRVITPAGRMAWVVDVFQDDTVDVIFCDMENVAAISDTAWANFRMDELEIALDDEKAD